MRSPNSIASRNKRVLNSPVLSDLRIIIESMLKEFSKTVFGSTNDVELKITQSWLSLSQKGQSHHVHSHTNSVVSGVLYINLAPRDGIHFYRNEELLWYQLDVGEANYYNSMRSFIETSVGDVVLFPSNITHGIPEVTEDVERVSLAFNTFFSGEIGREGTSNALRIDVE